MDWQRAEMADWWLRQSMRSEFITGLFAGYMIVLAVLFDVGVLLLLANAGALGLTSRLAWLERTNYEKLRESVGSVSDGIEKL